MNSPHPARQIIEAADTTNPLLEHKLKISFINSCTDTNPAGEELTIGEIVERFSTPQTNPKGLSLAAYLALDKKITAQKIRRDAEKNGEAFIPVKFKCSGTRAAVDVEMLYAYVLDFDGTADIDTIKAGLGDLCYIAYTSYSHSLKEERWRVIIFYNEPIVPELHLNVWQHFETIFPNMLDQRSRTLNQLWYCPACPHDAVNLFRFEFHEGELLDPTTLPAYVEVPADKTKGTASTKDFGSVIAALKYIDPEDRDIWIRVAMALKSEYGDDALDVWLEWSQRSDKYDEVDARYQWDSLKPKQDGVTIGTIYYLARQGGWIPPIDVWDAPIPFGQYDIPEIPCDLLPGVFGQFAASLAAMAEVPQALTTMAVLGVISAACSERFVVSPHSGWNEPVNLYILTALPPANNKSLVLNSSVSPIDDWERGKLAAVQPKINEAASKRKNEESQINSMRSKAAKETLEIKRRQLFLEVNQLEVNLTEVPIPPKVYVNDATPETLARIIDEQDGRLAIISDEGGIVETMAGLYSGGQSNYDILLKGIDGGRVRIERKDKSIDIFPYLTILLIVQPQVICNLGERKAFLGRGLFERFLYVIPLSRLGYRTLASAPIPDNVQRNYHAQVKLLLDIPAVKDEHGMGINMPRRLTLEPEAEEIWHAFRHEIEKHLRPEGKLHTCLGWGGKIVGFSLRIAGLLHVAEFNLSIHSINSSTMKGAVQLSRLLIEHALAAYGLMQLDQATSDAQVICAWAIKSQQHKLYRTDITRKFHGRLNSKKRFDAALSVLIDRNVISPLQQETTTPGKRQKGYYLVNPALFDQE